MKDEWEPARWTQWRRMFWNVTLQVYKDIREHEKLEYSQSPPAKYVLGMGALWWSWKGRQLRKRIHSRSGVGTLLCKYQLWKNVKQGSLISNSLREQIQGLYLNKKIVQCRSNKGKWSRLVVSDSLRPHGLQPPRLLRPLDFPGKNTGAGCHFLLQGIFHLRDWTWVSCNAADTLPSKPPGKPYHVSIPCVN